VVENWVQAVQVRARGDLEVGLHFLLIILVLEVEVLGVEIMGLQEIHPNKVGAAGADKVVVLAALRLSVVVVAAVLAE